MGPTAIVHVMANRKIPTLLGTKPWLSSLQLQSSYLLTFIQLWGLAETYSSLN